jgi:threonine/homoserine/homoserine lactone efflux protein
VPLAGAILRVAGALYLGYAGGRLLMMKSNPILSETPARSLPPAPRIGASLRRGFATNILNPKVGIFYLTLLPQFAPMGGGSVRTAWLLAIIHVGIVTLWFLALSALAGGIRPFLRSAHAMLVIDRVTGGIFILLGAGLLHSATMMAAMA